MRVTGFGVVAALLLALSGCDHGSSTQASREPDPVVVEAQQQFTYGGKPIPPYFLADFYGGPDGDDFWLRDMGDRIASISVPGLFVKGDGSYSNAEITDNAADGGFVTFDLGAADGDSEANSGYLGYRFVGTTPSGVTVLEYVGNTGGSGTIPGVMFVKFEMETLGVDQDSKAQRLVMRFVGEESWGDRVYRDVKLTGNTLWLGPTRTHIPAYQDMNEGERAIVLE